MRDVAWVEPTHSGLRLVGLLGENRLVQGQIVSIDLLHSAIVLQSNAPELSQSAPADRRDRKGGGFDPH